MSDDKLQDEALAIARHTVTQATKAKGLRLSDRALDELAIEAYEENPSLFEAMAMHTLNRRWN